MKKLSSKTAIFAILFTVFFSNNSFSILKGKDSTVCLKINGIILKSPVRERGSYTVELFLDNTKIDSSLVSVNKPFEFNLSKNLWYTLRISKNGFVPLLISIDTKLIHNNSTPYEFLFETELYHTTKINEIDRYTYDLPIGIVKFDESKNRFYPAEDYRAHIPGSF